MNPDKNDIELKLLYEQPNQLIEHYQPVIETIISIFIKRGFFQPEEKMELVQEINLQLLEKKVSKMQQQFNKSVLLRTYFSKIVRNACLEIIRKQKRTTAVDPENILLNTSDKTIGIHEKMALKEELVRLEGCFRALPKMRLKARLCLKASARVPFENNDLQFLDTPKTKNEIAAIKTAFFKDYQNAMNKDIFKTLVALFNKIEGKDQDADSLRKWTNQMLDRFVLILNGDPPHAAYTRETLKTLLQYYFEEASVKI